MARLSSNAESFVELARARRQQVLSLSQSLALSQSDQEFLSQGHGSQSQSQPGQLSSLLLQNKSLAKKNAVLQNKMAEMESRISDLIGENIQLKLAESNQSTLDELESKLNDKVLEMFGLLKEFRGQSQSNHGSQSEQRVTTSTKSLAVPRFISHSQEPVRPLRRYSMGRRYSFGPRGPSPGLAGPSRGPSPGPSPDSSASPEPPIESLESIPKPKPIESAQESAQESTLEPTPTSSETETTQAKQAQTKQAQTKQEKQTAKQSQEKQTQEKAEPKGKAKSEGPEPSARPTRTRKPVDYVGPSLRKKLRRESAQFVDAISGINYYKQEQSQEQRRRPLGDKTSQANSQSSLLDKKADKKADKKVVKNDLGNRRYTMIN